MEQVLNSIGLTLLVISFIVLMFQMKQHLTIQIFQLISAGQLGFFLLFLSLFIVYSFDPNLSFYFINTKLLFLLILRFGIFCGFFGVLCWFIVIEILRFEEDINILGNNLLLRSAYILLGISTGMALFDTSDKLVKNNYELNFNHPITFLLIFLMYGLFFVFQISLLIYKGRKYHLTTLKTFFNYNISSLLIFLYFCSFSIALVLFLLSNAFNLSAYSNAWVILGLISQICITLLLIRIPVILLTTEEPCLLMLLTEGGVSLYAKNFSTDISIPEQLIAGYLSALDSIGSKIVSSTGIVTSVKFEDKYTFLLTSVNSSDSPIRFCYIYKGMSYYASFRLSKFAHEINKNHSLWHEIISSLNEGRKMYHNSDFELQINKNFQKYSYD